MSLLFNLALALGYLSLWLSKQPILFLIAPSSWGCAKTCQCPKGENLSAPRFMLISIQILRQQLLKCANIYCPVGLQAYKPHRPPEAGNLWWFQGSSHKNQGSRWVYKLLYQKYQWTVMRQRESAKTVSNSVCSLRAPSCVPILMLKFQEKQKGGEGLFKMLSIKKIHGLLNPWSIMHT